MSSFERNIVAIYGYKGKKWLNELPTILANLIEQYDLSQLEPVTNMNFNYVVRGFLNEKPIIVKLGLNTRALSKEAQCLKAFEAHVAPKVIVNKDNMIIMEQAVPGTTLKTHFPLREIEATNILFHVIKSLHTAKIPIDHNFYHVKDLLKTLDKELDIPNNFLNKARKLRDKLLNTSTKEVLLHGDLHHDNILNNGRDWMVIDPKGFIGDPAFEPAAYLCNPIPDLLQENNPKQIIIDRIKLCAKNLNLDEQRIHDWFYAKSVLCWAWSLEDKLDASYWEKVLRFFS